MSKEQDDNRQREVIINTGKQEKVIQENKKENIFQ